MSRDINNLITFNDVETIKNAIEVITNEMVETHFLYSHQFLVMEEFRVLIESDKAEIVLDDVLILTAYNPRDLLHYLLVQKNKLSGISHLSSRGISIFDLETSQKQHLARLSYKPFFGDSTGTILSRLLYEHMSPQELADCYKLSARFIKKLRGVNRKAIISDILYEFSVGYYHAA